MPRAETTRRDRLRGAHGRPIRGELAALLAILAGVAGGCGEGGSPPQPPTQAEVDTPTEAPAPTSVEESLSADAKISTVRMLEADMASEPHPSDGGGRVELVRAVPLDGPGLLVVTRPTRFEIRYTAGPLGIGVGGTLFFQASMFWDWSPPQSDWPDGPGYTRLSTGAEGVELDASRSFDGMVAVTIQGRALRSGEIIDIVYGAGAAGAVVDRYAERGAELSISVDGNGDGFRKIVDPGVRVDVGPGPPAWLVVTGPTVVRPGERFTVHAHPVDGVGNAVAGVEGTLAWSVAGDASTAFDGLPQSSRLETSEVAGTSIEVFAPAAPAVLRLSATGVADLAHLSAVSNPIVVRTDAPRVLWGDLHGHSQVSDGTGTPDDYFAYARDVARLDVSALTDHDHWGLRFLDAHPVLWSGIKDSVARHHAPGEFVTLLGYEWTSWLHGHRHVLYFDSEGEVLSSMDPAYRTPAQLWAGLRGRDAMTFAHHSAGGPVSTNWAFGADPVLEPVTEITSVHGSSESPDTPMRIYSPVPGNTVRDVLLAGLRLGFIGSGDSHDGHPGLAHIASPSRVGGLAAIQSEKKTRAGVLEALRSRRTYATNGARIWLHVEIDGRPMGTTFEAESDAPDRQTLRIDVAGTAPIERVELIRTGGRISMDGNGGLDFSHERSIPRLARGEFHYVRVIQSDGHAAWSSPIFAD